MSKQNKTYRLAMTLNYGERCKQYSNGPELMVIEPCRQVQNVAVVDLGTGLQFILKNEEAVEVI